MSEREAPRPLPLQALLGICRSLGAATCGGPLSAAEQELLAAAPAAAVPTGWPAALRAGADPLGTAYLASREQSERRRWGAFYTPPELVGAMLRWTLAAQPELLVDAGCGSGRFAAAAVRANLAQAVLAVDLDPVACLLTRATLATLGATRATVRCHDFLALPRDWPAARTAFVGNPPYVRHHELSAATKARGRELATALGLPWSGLDGLHLHFWLQAAALARTGERICFVTSAEWLATRYGATLREGLAGPLGGRAVWQLAVTDAAFDDAMTTAVVACAERGQPAAELVWQTAVRLTADTDLASGPRRAVASLPAHSWQAVPAAPLGTVPVVAVGDYFRVSRGIATGHNAFFVLSPAAVAANGLQPWVRPVLTAARQLFSGALGDWRLLDPDPDLDLADPAHAALAAYLAAGAQRGVAEAYLCRHRRPWWRTRAATPAIVATYMARRPPAFRANAEGYAILNVFHGLHPTPPLTAAAVQQLTAWLNAHAAHFVGRTYQGGLRKIEPRELQATRLPAP
ncbi:MAG: methyltransferase [Fimbriimonadaceae bacterium]|nr:methyltransferase [Fimbriimonadaceae bacterium]